MNRIVPCALATVAFLLAACGDRTANVSDSSVASYSPADTPAVRPLATCNEHIMTGDGIGLLRIGMPVDSVGTVCTVTSDTVFRATEGQLARVVSVAMDLDTVYAEIVDERVWRILVRSQGIYTADSLGVGSSILMLTGFPDLNPMVGEGYLYVATTAHCGMSFRLSEPPTSAPHGEWTDTDLRNLGPNVHVTRILLIGCNRRPG